MKITAQRIVIAIAIFLTVLTVVMAFADIRIEQILAKLQRWVAN